MGPQARTVLASTTLAEEDANDVAAVEKAFTEHFVHPLNELCESARFHRRTQQPDEIVDAFFTALRTLAKRCNYSWSFVEDRLVRDRVIVGLLDRKLSDQLCQNTKLALQGALTQAPARQMSSRNTRYLFLALIDATQTRTDTQKHLQRAVCSFHDSATQLAHKLWDQYLCTTQDPRGPAYTRTQNAYGQRPTPLGSPASPPLIVRTDILSMPPRPPHFPLLAG
ncbi:hypothetical protein HPB49_004362 [Dermacentor silvarum]|uniref:Uncharacterized protein n=1 Tax=Dermacentor silvarum TaxID=543639 RepID=A0ACB8D2S7_DERSI|nr:hypothetical protein HPB49_004362 [Dermacentor silvarum]